MVVVVGGRAVSASIVDTPTSFEARARHHTYVLSHVAVEARRQLNAVGLGRLVDDQQIATTHADIW